MYRLPAFREQSLLIHGVLYKGIPLSYGHEVLGTEKRRRILAPGFCFPPSKGSRTLYMRAKQTPSFSHY